ncbi:MAG: hypothetical protein J6U66_08675, partial [Lachnospiraceae bacterium]|nr:hypothetical protein [Lachnospiraceae bacterium]
ASDQDHQKQGDQYREYFSSHDTAFPSAVSFMFSHSKCARKASANGLCLPCAAYLLTVYHGNAFASLGNSKHLMIFT